MKIACCLMLGNYPQGQVVYAEAQPKQQKKGPGMGTALLAGSWR